MFFIILIIISIIAWLIYKHYSDNQVVVSRPIIKYEEKVNKPKISAEVNESFNKEIQEYCFKNSLSVSELIRRSIKEYMSKQ